MKSRFLFTVDKDVLRMSKKKAEKESDSLSHIIQTLLKEWLKKK